MRHRAGLVTAGRLCCEIAEAAGEPLAATASYARNWLVLEVPGTWSRDVSDGAGLAPAARDAVQRWLGQTPAARVLFVRRPGRPRADRRLVFRVRADGDAPAIHRFEVSDDELATLDLEEVGELTTTRLVLVCGHGTRDRCCALRGTAVYAALARELDGDDVWISSHQGGHRFAANVLVLPHAVQLGRVSAEDAASQVARVLDGRVPSSGYRGCAAYPPEAQAAEIAIRAATGLDGLADLRLLSSDGRHVSFSSSDGREHIAVVERERGPIVPASCGAEPEAQSVLTARVVAAAVRRGGGTRGP